MNNVKIRKCKRILILSMIITTVFILNFIPFNLISSEFITEKDIKEEPQFLNKLEISGYSPSYSSAGNNSEAALHQSYLNTTYNIMLNASDTNNNTFSIPCPTDINFNSSYTKFEIDTIYAPNKTQIVEDDLSGGDMLGNGLGLNSHYISFEAMGNGYIETINMSLRESAGSSATLTIYLFNATNFGGDIRPDTAIYGTPIVSAASISGSTYKWYNFTDIHSLFNSSLTYNDIYFLRLDEGGLGTIEVGGAWDSNLSPDGVDESLVYDSDGTTLETSAGFTVDAGLILELSPLNNTPKPSEINLQVNNTVVNDNGITNSGKWESSWVNGSASGNLNYEISAEWWDITCNIKEAQINYTKTDIQTLSNFDILGINQDVNWTVNISGGINSFDDRLGFNRLNFTIPSTWDKATIKVFNGSIEIPSSNINTDYVVFPHRQARVVDATNGLDWQLKANSTNLLSSITVEGDLDYTAKFSEEVRFNATFSENVGKGTINLTVYSPVPRYENYTDILTISATNNVFTVSDWDISLYAEEYGVYLNQMFWNNGTAAGLVESYLTIIGDTSIDIISPPEDSIYKTGEFLDIVVEFNDTRFTQGVPEEDAIINYSLNEGTTYLHENVTYLGGGQHNININVNHPDFTEFGFVKVLINCSGDFYENRTIEYTFHRQITTTISPDNTATLGPIIRGQNTSYTFSYSDTLTTPITEANWSIIGSYHGFQSFLQNHNDGSYTIHLDSDNVNVAGSPFTLQFNISAVGNETQVITLTITVNIINTEIINTNWHSEVSRSSGLNQTFSFYFNDTTNEEPVRNLNTSNVFVKDNTTGTLWTASDFNWELNNGTGWGNYVLNISLKDIDSGTYTLEINVSKAPNYGVSLFYFSFYLRGNYTEANLVSITDPGGQLTPVGNNNFTIFEGSDVTLEFNITDLDYDNDLITTLADSYTVRYQNLNIPSNGIISTNSWEIATLNHRGILLTSNSALVPGDYEINITINKLNYEETSFVFNLTIIEKYQTRLTTTPPETVNAGLRFDIIIKAEYWDGSDWLPIDQSEISIIPYYNDIIDESLGPYTTNSTGEILAEIPTFSDTRTLNLTIQLNSTYYHLENSIDVSNIKIIPSDEGLSFKDLLPYLILIGAAVAVVGGSLAVHRGILLPKKREKARVLTEVKTIFDDAISLEHILVLYKATGTCIFFKSFGSEGIDPELISGFISAICSFGKDLVCQEELNEITYGDKMLLLSDGEFIRVALVLSKKASMILRKNLMDFIDEFEKSYANDLPNWRGQLNIFRNAGTLVDEILSTSIILPHEITYDYSNVKALKKTHSKDVLKLSNTLMEDSDRNFFFIATLLKEATEKTNKDTAEIFMGIKELRDKKILIPIEIGAIEAQPISQQELALINQKLDQLVNLSQEEKQKLTNDLAQMGPAEREAYLASLAEQQEIISAPIEEKAGATLIDNVKGAKKEIRKLKKIAKKANKKKDYTKTINICQNAINIATNWELTKEIEALNDYIRSTKIEDLQIKMKTLEKEAKSAVKQENYNEAAQKYKMSSKIASEIFKLGVTDMTKEVKRLSNKSKEYEKLI